MYGNGLNMDQVNNTLADNKPMVITVNEQDERMAVNVVEALMDLKRSMHERMNGMNAEIVRLRQELAISQEQLEDYNQLKYELDSLRREAATTAENIEQGLKDNTQLKQQNQQLHLEIESVQKRVAATHQTMDAIRKEMSGFISETRAERIQKEEVEKKKGFFARLFGG
jgi:chromosome segregation ATPase